MIRIHADGSFDGLALPFSRRNADDLLFDRDTDFALDWCPEGRPVLSSAPGAKHVAIGHDSDIREVDAGLWVEGQLNLAKQYRGLIQAALAKLGADDRASLRPVSMPHLIESRGDKAQRFPIVAWTLQIGAASPAGAYSAGKSIDLPALYQDQDLATPACVGACPPPTVKLDRKTLSMLAQMEFKNLQALKTLQRHDWGCFASTSSGPCRCRQWWER